MRDIMTFKFGDNTKHPDAKIIEILGMYYKQGLGYKKISKETGVERSYIRDIVKGRSRRNLFNKYKLDNPEVFK